MFHLDFRFYLQEAIFFEWAMLGSNQQPLPCESSRSVTDTSCCDRDSRIFSRNSLFSTLRLFGSVRLRSGSVAAPMLHILKVKRNKGGSTTRSGKGWKTAPLISAQSLTDLSDYKQVLLLNSFVAEARRQSESAHKKPEDTSLESWIADGGFPRQDFESWLACC
jgi:hypothetical protein